MAFEVKFEDELEIGKCNDKITVGVPKEIKDELMKIPKLTKLTREFWLYTLTEWQKKQKTAS